MDYSDLETVIAEYMGTGNFTAAQLKGFIDRAELRIGTDLRVQENQQRQSATSDANGQIEIGWDAGVGQIARIVEFYSVSTGSGTSLYQLHGIDPNERTRYPTSGNAVAYYTFGTTNGATDLDGSKLQLVPAQASVLVTVIFWYAIDPISGDLAGASAIRPVLTRYPNLYIDAALAEAAKSLRDYDAAAAFNESFADGIRRANLSYRKRFKIVMQGLHGFEAAPARGV